MKKYPFKIEIKRTNRKKSIALRIENDVAKIFAPKAVSDNAIEKIIENNIEWINLKIARNFTNSNLSTKKYVDGEIWDFYAQKQVLTVKVGAREGIELNLEKSSLTVLLTECFFYSKNTSEVVKNIIEKWIYVQMQEICTKLSRKYSVILNVKFTTITIKKYKSIWGMCKGNNLYYNFNLIFAPKWVIEYVVVHEVCHLKHRNHQKEFWQLVYNLYPQYKGAKQWLKIKGENLMYRVM